MAAVFEKLGIRFAYPENWTLDQEEAGEGQAAITVYSPGGGYWSVAIHAPEEDPNRLAGAAVKAMKQVYSDLDSEAVEETVADQPLVGYDLNFYCLDLTNTALVRAYQNDFGSYVVMCQAEDREYVEIEQVFRAMTASLVNSPPPPLLPD